MFIQTLSTNPSYFFAVIITVVISITLHELAHGWVAVKLGDRTPIETGHMTLNPLVHMGMFSLILLALVGIAFGAMPVDRSRLRGKYAESLVAVAGPAMNLLLGVVALIAFGLCIRFGVFGDGSSELSQVQKNALILFNTFGFINIALMLFNLIPLPPLDGSMILANFSPGYRRLVSGQIAQGVMMALFFAMFLGGSKVIMPAAGYVSNFIVKHIAGTA